jgi:hypothetical protein
MIDAPDSEPEPVGDPIPFSVQISISGFDEEEGTRLWNIISEAIETASQVIDISTLEGVTITPNYREALAQFDNGMPGVPVTAPTVEEFGSGCAMSVNCKRGDAIKSHVFLDAGIGGHLLMDKSDPNKILANNIVFHEFAHVYDYARTCKDLADAKFPNHLTRWLFLLTNSTWSEFYACFATCSTDPSLDDYVTVFEGSLRQCPDEVHVAIYREYCGDMNDLMEFVKARVGLLFKLAGYVLGHLAGKDLKLADTHPAAWQTIEDAGFADTWHHSMRRSGRCWPCQSGKISLFTMVWAGAPSAA